MVTGVSRPEDQEHPEVEIAGAAEGVPITGDGGGDDHGIVRSASDGVGAPTRIGLRHHRVAGRQHLQVAVARLNRATGGDVQAATVSRPHEEVDTRLNYQCTFTYQDTVRRADWLARA